MPRRFTPHQKLYAVIGLLLLMFLLLIGLSASRAGETKLEVNVIPEDAQILINGQPSKAGTHYLKTDKYTITAKKDGFADDTVTVDLNDGSQEVNLIPAPESEAARKFLEDNPELQQERERIGAQRANRSGEAREEETPIISILPVSEINDGPFSIDFGPSETRKDGVYLVVSDSSVEGRNKALNWLKERGQDPTDLELRFEDFTNPLTGGAQ